MSSPSSETVHVTAAIDASFDVDAAARLAESLVSPLGPRWIHVQAVAARAAQAAPSVALATEAPTDAERLVSAAWLHDIGYAPSLIVTGLHALDGGNWLASRGWPHSVCRLVAHHSQAVREATTRGLLEQLLTTWPQETGPVADALTWADMTTGPAGVLVSVHDRLAEILTRYPPNSPVHEAIIAASSDIVAAAERTDTLVEFHSAQVSSWTATPTEEDFPLSRTSPHCSQPSAVASQLPHERAVTRE